MAETNYPIHFYKNLSAPRYANDAKQVAELEADGWTSVRANIGPQEYPRHVYRDDGDVALVGDYDKNGEIDLEKAQAEEAKYAKLGYGRKPVAANSVPEAPPVKGIMEAIVDVKANAERLTALESDVADIKSGMGQILAALNAKPAAPAPDDSPKRGLGRPKKGDSASEE